MRNTFQRVCEDISKECRWCHPPGRGLRLNTRSKHESKEYKRLAVLYSLVCADVSSDPALTPPQAGVTSTVMVSCTPKQSPHKLLLP